MIWLFAPAIRKVVIAWNATGMEYLPNAIGEIAKIILLTLWLSKPNYKALSPQTFISPVFFEILRKSCIIAGGVLPPVVLKLERPCCVRPSTCKEGVATWPTKSLLCVGLGEEGWSFTQLINVWSESLCLSVDAKSRPEIINHKEEHVFSQLSFSFLHLGNGHHEKRCSDKERFLAKHSSLKEIKRKSAIAIHLSFQCNFCQN